MNIKKLGSNSSSRQGFIAGVSASTLVFLLFNLTPGITDVKKLVEINKHGNSQPAASSEQAVEEHADIERVIKYLPDDNIVVLDEKGEVLAKAGNKYKKDGALTGYRNVSLVTVTENVVENTKKTQTHSLLDLFIKPANAATIVYERHYTIVDGDIVDCKIHRKLPLPHVFVKSCM